MRWLRNDYHCMNWILPQCYQKSLTTALSCHPFLCRCCYMWMGFITSSISWPLSWWLCTKVSFSYSNPATGCLLVVCQPAHCLLLAYFLSVVLQVKFSVIQMIFWFQILWCFSSWPFWKCLDSTWVCHVITTPCQWNISLKHESLWYWPCVLTGQFSSFWGLLFI